MKKIPTFNRLCRKDTGNPAATQYNDVQRVRKSPMISFSVAPVFRRVCTACIAVLTVATATACAPAYKPPQEVESRPPSVSYNYSSDEGLVEANTKARAYCGQYASTASMKGTIAENRDGSKTVTFECVKTAAIIPARPVPPPPSPPMEYVYRSDNELLRAIESADAYCAESGRVASTRIVTNADGSKTLTYQCIPR